MFEVEERDGGIRGSGCDAVDLTAPGNGRTKDRRPCNRRFGCLIRTGRVLSTFSEFGSDFGGSGAGFLFSPDPWTGRHQATGGYNEYNICLKIRLKATMPAALVRGDELAFPCNQGCFCQEVKVGVSF